MQVGVDIGSYTFDASAGTITFSGVTLTNIFQIKPIINGSTGEQIFNPATAGVFGSLSGSILTLDHDTSVLGDDADNLYICVNIPNSSSVVDEGVSTIKSGQGFLTSVIIAPTDKECRVEIYDSLTASGTLIGVINVEKKRSFSHDFNLKFTTGLTVDVSNDGSPELTVIYK